jgi:hypothetical protein
MDESVGNKGSQRPEELAKLPVEVGEARLRALHDADGDVVELIEPPG